MAVDYGVGWHTVMQAVRDHGRPLVADPARLSGVTALGVDETAFLAATSRHHTEFVTGIVDLTGHVSGRPERATRLLDVVEGRSGKALCDWVSARDQDWRDRVEVAALSTPSADMRPRCALSCPARCGCWTPSMSPASA